MLNATDEQIPHLRGINMGMIFFFLYILFVIKSQSNTKTDKDGKLYVMAKMVKMQDAKMDSKDA